MKVLLTADVLKGTKTGVEHYAQQVFHGLNRNLDVEATPLFTDQVQAQHLGSTGQHELIHSPLRRWPTGMFLPPPKNLAIYDIIHCPTVRVPFLPRSTDRPRYVMTVPDLVPLVTPELHKFHYRVYFRHVLPRLLCRFNAIVAISQSTANDLERFYPGVCREVRVIYPGTRWSPIRPDEVQPKGNYFLAVGTLEPRKNLKRLISAFRVVKQKHPTLSDRLLIVGKPGWGGAKEDTEAHTDSPDIQWLGYVADEELAQLYKRARALVYPSLYEGFGLPVVEAMALGCPVITSDKSSLPEAGGDAAVYVDPENIDAIVDAIERIIFERNLANELIAKGLSHARSFTWDRCAQQLVELYHQLA